MFVQTYNRNAHAKYMHSYAGTSRVIPVVLTTRLPMIYVAVGVHNKITLKWTYLSLINATIAAFLASEDFLDISSHI